MVNSRAKGSMQLVAKHTAAGTEATHTFTLPSPDIMDNTSYYELVFDGGATASLALEILVNGLSGSLYQTKGSEITAGAEVLTNITNKNDCEIMSTTLMAAAGTFTGRVIFQLQSITTDYITIHSQVKSTQTGGYADLYSHYHADTPTLISITIQTSTSTWTAGTRFSLYRITR